MYLLRNIKDVNGDNLNIAIMQEKITAILKEDQVENYLLDNPNLMQVDLPDGTYVSYGWIDIHTHCYPDSPIYHAIPDEIGYLQGVTLLVDAGSVGANDIERFYEAQKNIETQVRMLLNIACVGIKSQNELSLKSNLDGHKLATAIGDYPNLIFGFKARISKSVVGETGVRSLKWFNKMRTRYKLTQPLMVHIGNSPPPFSQIVDNLQKNDIITHIFNGKNNEVFTSTGEASKSLQLALEKKINFDLGHGTESFNYNLAQNALQKNGDFLTTISSDIYEKNKKNGVVGSLALIMSKMMTLGLSLRDVIEKVTKAPAKIFNLYRQGEIVEYNQANLTFFKLEEVDIIEKDSYNNTINVRQLIVPIGVVIRGKLLMEGK